MFVNSFIAILAKKAIFAHLFFSFLADFYIPEIHIDGFLSRPLFSGKLFLIRRSFYAYFYGG